MDSNSNSGFVENFYFAKHENENKTESVSEEITEKNNKTRKAITEDDTFSNDLPPILSYF